MSVQATRVISLSACAHTPHGRATDAGARYTHTVQTIALCAQAHLLVLDLAVP